MLIGGFLSYDWHVVKKRFVVDNGSEGAFKHYQITPKPQTTVEQTAKTLTTTFG
jgi:hypothetical protein